MRPSGRRTNYRFPAEATLAAARIGHEAGGLVVLDGTVSDERILEYADVVRADEKEAEGLSEEILEHGPSLLALAQPDGNLFVWHGGRVKVPLTGGKVVDTTGGGDAFVAALTAALLEGPVLRGGRAPATAASGSTVSHVSGRPDLRHV